MSFRNMFRRWILLALIAAVVSGVAMAALLNRDAIARMLAPEYVPLPDEKARQIASHERTACDARYYWPGSSSQYCNRDYFQFAKDSHRREYDWEISKRASEVKDFVENSLAVALTILGLAAFWALCRALYTRLSPAMRAGTRLATSSLEGGVSEVLQRRRFSKAEKDFQTLKSLYDNGLITEDVFNQRKALLSQTLREAAK